MLYLGVPREHVIREHWDDRTALVTNKALHFSIHFTALCIVEFGPGLFEELIETLMVPIRIVPTSTRDVVQSEHGVFRGRTRPIARGPRLLHPDVRPIAVIRFPDDIDVDTRTGGMLLIERRRVDGSGERRIRGAEIDCDLIQTSLPEIEFGLVGIVDTLLEFARVILVGRADWGCHSQSCRDQAGSFSPTHPCRLRA